MSPRAVTRRGLPPGQTLSTPASGCSLASPDVCQRKATKLSTILSRRLCHCEPAHLLCSATDDTLFPTVCSQVGDRGKENFALSTLVCSCLSLKEPGAAGVPRACAYNSLHVKTSSITQPRLRWPTPIPSEMATVHT